MNLSIAPLYSSSGGNSIFIGSQKTSILIDAGLPGSKIEQALKSIGKTPGDLSAILVTHEHTDHIKGAGVLSRKYGIPIYANAPTWEQMQPKIGNVEQKNIRMFDGGDFYIKDLCITPFDINHDAACPVGFSVFSGTKHISVLTDTGCVTQNMMSQVKGSDIILLESNHDVDMLKNGAYPYYLKTRILSRKGHLSNADAALTVYKLISMGTRKIILGHLSSQNNEELLAFNTVATALKTNGIKVGLDVLLSVAKKHFVSGYYEV